MARCENVINLRTPSRSERRRGFQPLYYTVWIYRCPCGHEHAIRNSAYRGPHPEPSVGGIICGAPLKEGASDVQN